MVIKGEGSTGSVPPLNPHGYLKVMVILFGNIQQYFYRQIEYEIENHKGPFIIGSEKFVKL
jgi:hypothetical protein